MLLNRWVLISPLALPMRLPLPHRHVPNGSITETPLHSEPAQMLSAVEGGELDNRITPTPASTIDYHQPADTHQYYYAQPPAETIQRAAITPIQPQPIQPPPHAPVLDPNAEGVLESDPAIASLHAMFPDFDLFVLQSVLEAAGGDKDRAVDGLLSMSDPDFGRSQSQDQAQAIGAGGGNRVRVCILRNYCTRRTTIYHCTDTDRVGRGVCTPAYA